jgi:hypothetical protein
MTTMMRWDPFQDLRSAQDEMAQMSPMLAHALGLHAQQGNERAMTTAWAPAVDISERKDAYLVTVELPGMKAEDLDITMEDGLLTIQGERHFAHHPARPCDGRGDPGLVRGRRAPDPGAQGRGGQAQAHPGPPRPHGDLCGEQRSRKQPGHNAQLSREGRRRWRRHSVPRHSRQPPTPTTTSARRPTVRFSCHAAHCADRPWSPSVSVCTRSLSAPAAGPDGSKTATSSGRSTRSKNPPCSPQPPTEPQHDWRRRRPKHSRHRRCS